jgi:hypothetical protein
MASFLIRLLDALIAGMNIGINSIYRVLNYLIETVERVSRQIVALLFAGIKLGFYGAPFIGMVLIGRQRNQLWLSILGWSIIGLTLVLMLRDFLAQSSGEAESGLRAEPHQAFRVFLFVLALNVIVWGYLVADYTLGIDLYERAASALRARR